MNTKTWVVIAALATAVTLAAACSSPPPAAPATATPLPPTATPVPRIDPPEETPTRQAREVPTPEVVPTQEVEQQEGPLAPDFELVSATGVTVSLADLLEGRDGAVIIFYRGFF